MRTPAIKRIHIIKRVVEAKIPKAELKFIHKFWLSQSKFPDKNNGDAIMKYAREKAPHTPSAKRVI